jgi:recombination protein RecA
MPTTARRSARAATTPANFLRENSGLAVEIENKVRDSLGIALLPTAGGDAPEAKAAKAGKAKADKDGVIEA